MFDGAGFEWTSVTMIHNVTGQFYDYRQSPQIIANSPQFAAICHFLMQFAAKCHNSPQLIAKRLRPFFGLNPHAPFYCGWKKSWTKMGGSNFIGPLSPPKNNFFLFLPVKVMAEQELWFLWKKNHRNEKNRNPKDSCRNYLPSRLDPRIFPYSRWNRWQPFSVWTPYFCWGSFPSLRNEFGSSGEMTACSTCWRVGATCLDVTYSGQLKIFGHRTIRFCSPWEHRGVHALSPWDKVMSQHEKVKNVLVIH